MNCNSSPTTALGNAINVSSNGTVLAISGICQQSIVVPSNLSCLYITNASGDETSSLVSGDGIEGQLTIFAGCVVINGITLEGTATDTGLTSNVLVAYGGTASISNSQIINSQRIGLLALWGGHLELFNSSVSSNGIANVTGQKDGVHVSYGATAQIGELRDDGSVDTAEAVTISGNAGNGVSVASTSHFSMVGGSITGNKGSELLIGGASVAGLVGVTISQAQTPYGPTDFAVSGIGTSTIVATGGTSVAGNSVAGGIFVASGSSLILNSATVSSTLTSAPAIEVTGSSNAILGGNNTVTNTGGTAIEVDHGSSLQQENVAGVLPDLAGLPIAAVVARETITGAGLVQEQSSMDLGQGLISSSPSISWTTGSSGISVQQNSSFRVSGGVSITGAVAITQGSNAFANTANGGTNAITSASCPFTNVPSSHWASPNKVSPAVPSATSYASAVSPECLAF